VEGRPASSSPARHLTSGLLVMKSMAARCGLVLMAVLQPARVWRTEVTQCEGDIGGRAAVRSFARSSFKLCCSEKAEKSNEAWDKPASSTEWFVPGFIKNANKKRRSPKTPAKKKGGQLPPSPKPQAPSPRAPELQAARRALTGSWQWCHVPRRSLLIALAVGDYPQATPLGQPEFLQSPRQGSWCVR
jgi:hypothetical protein